jgi:hypothetical protein
VVHHQAKPRYDAGQVVEAIGRARGDGRWFLVEALTQYPGPEREQALTQVLELEVRPDERNLTLRVLAKLRPETYLRQWIQDGLRSRSISVQQVVIADLPGQVGEGLDPGLCDEVESWLRRRLRNPRRANTWATWEVPGVALTLVPSYGMAKVRQLLEELAPRMQPEESQRLHRALAADDEAFPEVLRDWHYENGVRDDEHDERDPTALVYVDRVMKRLGFSPTNPDSAPYDDLADAEGVAMYEIDINGQASTIRRG